MIGGIRGNETITFGGLLQDADSPLGRCHTFNWEIWSNRAWLVFIESLSSKFAVRFTGGESIDNQEKATCMPQLICFRSLGVVCAPTERDSTPTECPGSSGRAGTTPQSRLGATPGWRKSPINHWRTRPGRVSGRNQLGTSRK
jgi:hypothetical protein